MAVVLYKEYVQQSTSALLPALVNCLCLPHLQRDTSGHIRSTLQGEGFSSACTQQPGTGRCSAVPHFPHSPEPRNLCSLLIHVKPTLWTPASCVQWYLEGHLGSEIEAENVRDGTERRKTHPSHLQCWCCVSTWCPVSFNILVQVPETELHLLESKLLMSCSAPFLLHHICINQIGFQWQIIKTSRPALWQAACSLRPKHFVLPTIPWDEQVLHSGSPSPQHSLTLTGQHRCRNFYFTTLSWQDLVLTMCNLPLSQHWSPSQACSFHSFIEGIR